jgi:hypothetical protein
MRSRPGSTATARSCGGKVRGDYVPLLSIGSSSRSVTTPSIVLYVRHSAYDELEP